MPANTLVRDVMSANPVTLRADQAITEAADVRAEHGYGAMPVVDDAGQLLGLLSDEDLIVSEARVHAPTFFNQFSTVIPLPGQMKQFEEEIHKIAGSTVGEVMDEDPVTIRPEDTLEELATRMHEADVSHIPVVDGDGRVVGIVARGDVVRYIARTT